MTDLVELVRHLGAPRVLVVGDVMLDRYVWGNAERISQEAPVVLLRADRREERLGGASSVATMLQALGANTSVVGVVGSDGDGFHARRILTDLGIDADGVIADADRPTSVKERYIGRAQARHPQQMIRVDYESREPVCEAIERQLADVLGAKVRETDIVLVSDDEMERRFIARGGQASEAAEAGRVANEMDRDLVGGMVVDTDGLTPRETADRVRAGAGGWPCLT